MWIKDPDETLEYKFDYAPLQNGSGDSNWLDRTSSPGEYISSFSITIDSPGLTIEASTLSNSNTAVVAMISGGTAGNKYPISCKITTSANQVKENTEVIWVTNR